MKIGCFALIVGASFPGLAYAAIDHGCDSHMLASIWTDRDGHLAGLDAAEVTCPTPHTMAYAGLSYYGDDKFIYEGPTAGARLRIGKVFSPFIGAGVLAGYAQEEQEADHDGIDNNGDGQIDEAGEKSRTTAVSGYVYPELGVTFQPWKLGLTASARRFYGTRISGDVIYTLGLSFAFGDESHLLEESANETDKKRRDVVAGRLARIDRADTPAPP